MKGVFFAIATLLACRIVLPTAAAAQTVPFTANESLLNVDGTGTITRPPDEARVSVTIETNADVASRSAADNTRVYDAFVTPLENVGKVIDAATASRVEQVGDVSFDLRDQQSAYTAALAAAMDDAKRMATTLADAGGLHLVRIRAVSAGPQGLPVQPFSTFGGSFGAAIAAPTPPPTDIRPNGPISVTAFVHVTYEIR
ncbi:MAG: SIMPL domain-containing protein [Candidatus Eremiobacteraeota bacterium]|nr:SIMPL domain-containing protein [Candidatus Eremiobacteraeota bacterium]MBC5801742.1 SIMPL domain-containing protein [Candidatus Eremiobacteraeota bacterium]MBC5821510.1 SIMPL domain-containing protein [Candidatus Eremiobacteraeota bacterium]